MSTPTSAAPPKTSDGFPGYAALQLRTAIAKSKDFDKRWALVSGDEDKAAVHYILKGAATPFQGVKVDKAVLAVSKRMHVVVAFALSISGERCTAIEKTLNAAWGQSEMVGGLNHVIEWLADRVDASLEQDGPDACMLYIADRAWDDQVDEYKKRGL